MNKLSINFLTILLILFLSNQAHAAERGYHYFLHSNLNLSWCFNLHSDLMYYDPIKQILYYKGLSKALNDYIKEKVQAGKLENKKFEIQTGCIGFGGHAIKISQNRNGYFIFVRGAPNLEYFVKIVNYFSSENWESFVYDFKKVNSITALKTFNNILEKEVGHPNMDFFKGEKTKVWQLDELEIYYENDKLDIYYNDALLNIELRDPLPTKINNRYFIVSKDKILVYEHNNLISIKEIPVNYYFVIKGYREWINFLSLSTGSNLLIYSYENNKFYEIKKTKVTSEEVFLYLIEALKSEDSFLKIKSAAAQALGTIKDPRAVPSLIEALKGEDANVQYYARWALGEIKDPGAVLLLIETLKNENWIIRLSAAEVLGKIKDPRAVPSLIKALKDEDSDVRKKAAWALGEIKDSRAVPALSKASKDTSPRVRENATKALKKIN